MVTMTRWTLRRFIMARKAKMTLSSMRMVDKVVATRDESHLEHAFTVRLRVKVSTRIVEQIVRKLQCVSDPEFDNGIESLELEWGETIDWFEHGANGMWHLKGTETKDMYAANPRSTTFRNWEEMRYLFAAFLSEMNQPPAALTAAVRSCTSRADKDKTAEHWIAEHGLEWTIPITDAPSVRLDPAAGSGGDGSGSLVTSNSRRRVIYFDVGFKGSSTRVTATQILESVNGTPTIFKFFVPGIRKVEADDLDKLAAWRAELVITTA